MRSRQQPVAGASRYPPPVYAVPEDRTTVPPAGILWWAGLTLLIGVVMGVVWWLCAPAGFLFGDGLRPGTWLLRDLTLAALGLAAGLVLGGLVAARLDAPGLLPRVVTVVAGSALGSLAAVLVGEGLAVLFGPRGSEDLPGSTFLLHSPGAAVIWPATVALVIFLATVSSLARSRRR
ncbi:hypothetical protein [Arthrobacter sp. Br18]|uniref:hypothetical protein n=1 Tax=Arthrobacter sp. Br18 TaxID=1312954 RepID=UPI00068772B8|nr:hypothetical protein [Arthrobacter sp. Br18]